MEKNKNVTVNAEFVGSGAGIEAVTAGTVDIGSEHPHYNTGVFRKPSQLSVISVKLL